MTFWIFLLCFCVAVLSGLGVGGGGLLAVILSLFSDIPALTVQGINLYFFLFSGAASLVVQLLTRRMRFGVIALCTVFGLVGTVLGSALAHSLGGSTTRKLFGLLLVVAGLLTLFRCFAPLFRPKKQNKENSSPEHKD